jgi:hypothetical protein
MKGSRRLVYAGASDQLRKQGPMASGGSQISKSVAIFDVSGTLVAQAWRIT